MRSALWQVAKSLVPHLAGVSSERRAGTLQALAPLPSVFQPAELAAAKAFGAAALEADAAQPPPATPAEPADVQAVALRRAHALAARAGCGNPRCASLAGASEAAGRGKRCSACKLLRFCGPECSRQEWRWHKLGCSVLKARREAAAALNGCD